MEDWRLSLTASERYDTIQRIQLFLQSNPIITGSQSAFSIENDAYHSSSSREEYDAACSVTQPGHPQRQFPLREPALVPKSSPPFINPHGSERATSPESGERIGQYKNCKYIASGVTAEVYRCNDRALKVITETHNIAPHNPLREAKILAELKRPCIPLLETFRDQEQRFTLVFPYMPFTLTALLDAGSLSSAQIRLIFTDLFEALKDIHAQGIIHRDIKPQAILLASPGGPAYLSDFGIAWHPELSASSEPSNDKVLDIGTGPYRAPEVLFGDKAYGTAVDMWGAGCMLAECARRPPKPLFDSRPVHEDGNQLGLILNIFQTLGTPTKESWPEAQTFKTPPFAIYQPIEGRPWDEILIGLDEGWSDMVKKMVKFNSGRMTAAQALEHPYMSLD